MPFLLSCAVFPTELGVPVAFCRPVLRPLGVELFKDLLILLDLLDIVPSLRVSHALAILFPFEDCGGTSVVGGQGIFGCVKSLHQMGQVGRAEFNVDGGRLEIACSKIFQALLLRHLFGRVRHELHQTSSTDFRCDLGPKSTFRIDDGGHEVGTDLVARGLRTYGFHITHPVVGSSQGLGPQDQNKQSREAQEGQKPPQRFLQDSTVPRAFWAQLVT